MSDSFNKNLSMFLTSCRESALNELAENNSEYRKLLADMAEFSNTVQKALPDEYEIISDTFFALARMEINYMYLRGFRDCLSLYKRFDGSFPESLDFEEFFIKDIHT